MSNMRRREFITLIGGAACWPLAARAQQPAKKYRIAIVSPAFPVRDMREGADNPQYDELFGELRRLGYVEGQNLVAERYSAERRPERYVPLAEEVARAKPDLIVTAQNPLIRALKNATDSIPIVAAMADPTAYGIVASLARPGGNVTGVSVEAGLEIWAKRLQILREIIPTSTKVGFIGSRLTWDGPQASAIVAAAREAGISLLGPPVETSIGEEGYRRALEAMTLEHVDGLIVSDSSDNFTFRRVIVSLAEKARLAAVYPYREYFAIGGLVTYGSDLVGVYRRVAGYADQILRGKKPGEIPVYLESKFELLVNSNAAKALGLTIPTSLLVRADEVIE
jgi:putative ABC transport system substrate-binding protein